MTRKSPARFSRGVPYALSEAQQKKFLLALKNDSVKKDIESLLKINLDTMSVQQQLSALRDYVDAGYGIALVSQIAHARQDLREVAREERDELTKDDQMRLLRAELDQTKETLERAQRTIDLMDEEALADRSKRRRA